jgi:hypothetical protein
MPDPVTSISPRLLKGALAVYTSEERGASPALIVFQYNPEQVRRTLALRAPQQEGQSRGGAAREDVRRAAGPPAETINLSISLSAVDQLAANDQDARQNGIARQLATLEMLLYPPTSTFQRNQNLANQGQVQVSPAQVPLVVLIWGQNRVVPVAITSFGVTEEAFDQNLNPIQAKIELALKVLTYLELAPNTIGREAYVAYQRNKENLASTGTTRDADIERLLPQGGG